MVKVKSALLAKKKPKTLKKGSKKLKNKKSSKIEEQNSDSEIEEFFDKTKDSDEEDATNNDAEDLSSEEELDEEALEEKHKQDLEKLKQTDPEFYKFLQENDKKLLHFSVSDDEGAEESDTPEEETVHKPTEDLEVASDESDYEAEEGKQDDKVITLKLIKKWQTDIQTEKSNKTIIEVTQAFHAALKRISSDEEQDDEPVRFKVDGSAVFNGVVQLCVMHLGPAIRRFLGIKPGSKQPPHKCKKFNKIKRPLKGYFMDLLKLLVGVTSTNIQAVLLKHLHYMAPMLNSYTNITKSILTKLIRIWGTSDDSARVLAFFCILRIVNNQMAGTLDTCLKSMYMTYVKNSKFVSTSSLASINFMKRSLVEMFALDLNVAYSHVFLYIRQLAIHLRNAITVNKKENVQAVYNWQFVNSLRLWGALLGMTYSRGQMQQLVYPFVQVCLGTIKLVPTAQYYPLRFHIVQVLIDFTKESDVFIPVLPFLLEVLTSFDFNKKHQKVSMKPLRFTCLLRLSKSQLQENGFKDTLIDTIYSQLLEYLAHMSHTISFPDLSLVCIIQIKRFLKKCKLSNHTRKLKQALEKIEQNALYIETERSKLTLNLTDFKQIEGWESQVKVKGTPLMTFYETWSKVRNMKKNKEATNNDLLGDYKLPSLKKLDKKQKQQEGPVELFPSDSEDEEIEGLKKRRGKRGGKNARKLQNSTEESEQMDVDGEEDIVQDISADDW
ncbi:nucleolar complex protein 2 homolog [Anthonomus grandis grandis]|uniref:nucleolar complex protein 2 homolog n=1 Tax=Anthonomus grandis grandis TaxID=2921223 RepID=UPI00216674A3|nr:nucleolar complex protein 2 homolog [Anthonomus grandis grandis]